MHTQTTRMSMLGRLHAYNYKLECKHPYISFCLPNVTKLSSLLLQHQHHIYIPLGLVD